jgi:predicted  nucleic acid-binding Zn-ribbon protein
MTTKPMTRVERRETMSDLRDAIEEINSDLDGARDELKDALETLKEIRQRIAGLKEDKAWRVSAYRFLKDQK